MASWQPPIPAGALYSKPARAIGPAIALLAYCYDLVQRDGWFDLSLKDATADMDEHYPTIKRWWQLLADGPFFAAIENHGRRGMRVQFKSVWIDWRILESRSTNNPFDNQIGTETGSEMIPNEQSGANRDHNRDTIGTETGSEMIPKQSGNKVLMITDQAIDSLALNAPQKAPEKRRNRDPNQQHPACQIFFEKTGYRPNRQQSADISSTVVDCVQWEASVSAWLGRGFKINDANGMIDWYLHPDKMERKNGTHKSERPTPDRRNGTGPGRAAELDAYLKRLPDE